MPSLAFLLLSRNPFGRSRASWLQEGLALWGMVPGVPRLRAPSSLVGLTDPRDPGELAISGVGLGAWKSSLGQLQVLQVEVWGSLGWDAPEISHAQWV